MSSIENPTVAPDVAEDPKRQRVLEGAMKVVLAYGYHRTTMDDIARAAEMSRPALYLLFRNKADIYRACARRMFDLSSRRMGEILEEDSTLGEHLFKAIDLMMIQMMQEIATSPHGAELLDLKSELCGGMVEDWHGTLSVLFARAIGRDAARQGVDLEARGLSAVVLAELLIDGLEGMKMRTQDAEAQRKATRQLVRVIELSLAP